MLRVLNLKLFALKRRFSQALPNGTDDLSSLFLSRRPAVQAPGSPGRTSLAHGSVLLGAHPKRLLYRHREPPEGGMAVAFRRAFGLSKPISGA